jgi:anthranilate phosphoribosyltransferase
LVRGLLEKVVEFKDLESEEAANILRMMMRGEMTPAQVGAFLVAIRMKGETTMELYGMAKVMREFCVKVEMPEPSRLLDIVGTGGDLLKTVNVSTLSALVVASTGVAVAKHGNRSFSGICGSADLLELLGVNISLQPDTVKKCIDETRFGFMFAPIYHPAMRNVASPRREIGIRTFFNLLGPLTNPAGAGMVLLGVAERRLLRKVAEVAAMLGIRRGLVVCSRDGMDEISPQSETEAYQILDGDIERSVLKPEDFGWEPVNLDGVTVSSKGEAAEHAVKVLSGVLSENDPRMRLVLANSAASLLVAGLVSDLKEGVRVARDALRERKPLDTLRRVIEVSGGEQNRLDQLLKRVL